MDYSLPTPALNNLSERQNNKRNPNISTTLQNCRQSSRETGSWELQGKVLEKEGANKNNADIFAEYEAGHRMTGESGKQFPEPTGWTDIQILTSQSLG